MEAVNTCFLIARKHYSHLNGNREGYSEGRIVNGYFCLAKDVTTCPSTFCRLCVNVGEVGVIDVGRERY